MHPIERLRYVAHAIGADPATLVSETELALRDLQNEPAGLVLACRRILERHPTALRGDSADAFVAECPPMPELLRRSAM